MNHRLAHYKRAGEAIFRSPKPYDSNQGWEKTEEGTVEPKWSSGPILPPTLIDLLQQTVDKENDEEVDELHESENIEFDEDGN